MDDTASHAAVSEAVRADMQAWVQDVVVGLNLCPFAARVLRRNLLRMEVLSAPSDAEVVQRLLSLSAMLLSRDSEDLTVLLVLAAGYAHFADFLDLVHRSEQRLEREGFAGQVQLASFHPDYCFAEVPADDAANWSNRSPYPALHVLTEASVSRSVRRHGDPESIPRRNVLLLRTLGAAYIRRLTGQEPG